MGQQAVNTIIQALQHGMALAEQIRARKQQKEENDRAQTLREKQQADLEAQQKVQNAAADKMFELRKSELEAQQAQHKYNVGRQFQLTGIAPDDYKVIQGVTPAPTPQTQTQIPQINQSTPVWGQPSVGVGSTYPGLSDQASQPPLTNTELQDSKLIDRGGGTMSIPSLENSPEQKLVKRQAQEASAQKIRDYQVEQQAAERRQLNVMQATQEAEGKRILATMAQEHINKKDEMEQQLQGQKELAEIHGRSQLEAVRARLSGLEGFEQMPNAAETLTRMKTGTVSQEEINRSPFKKELSKYAIENGIQILPQAKTNQIQAIETMGNMLPVIRRMILARDMNPFKVNTTLTEEGRQFDSDAKAIRAAAPQASVATTGVRRFTQQELARFDDFFIPNKIPGLSSTKANMSKYNEFVTNLNQAVDQVTKGLPKEQIDAIRANLQSKGLTFMKPEEVPQVAPETNFNVKVPGSRLLQGQEPKVELGPRPAGSLKVYRQNPKTGVLELQTGGQ